MCNKPNNKQDRAHVYYLYLVQSELLRGLLPKLLNGCNINKRNWCGTLWEIIQTVELDIIVHYNPL